MTGCWCCLASVRGRDGNKAPRRDIAIAGLVMLAVVWMGALPAVARAPVRPQIRPAATAPAPSASLPAPPTQANPADSPQLTPPAAALDASPAVATEPQSLLPQPPAAGLATSVSPPQDPRLAQVFSVFDSHCAQCHQAGKAGGAGPLGGLAHILDLAELAREPHLVRRGEPDASLLYQVLLDRHRPVELSAEQSWPGAEDIARVRTWIEDMAGSEAPCPAHKLITTQDVASAIDAAALAAGEAAAQDLRFITLAHAANACATPAEMEAYRQGVSKLLNSLSWGARPVAPQAIDEARSVLAFKLSDIGWVDEHWNGLARAEPKAFALDLSGQLKAPGANTRPIRGDWLAATAPTPPYYAELLGLPPTLDETARLLGINRHPDTPGGRGMRAGLKSSAVTRGPRVVERFHADSRRFWLTYDFSDGVGEHDIFDRPLGGIRGAPDKSQFRAESQRLIFGLPNGFMGYAIYEPEGHRIDQLPTRLEIEAARSPGPTLAGLSCLGCHTAGVKPFTDAMRAHVAGEKFTQGRDVREQTLAVYDTANEWTRVLDEDGFRYRRALIQAGIDPDLTLHGLDPLAALAARYGRSIDLATVAAELGLTREALDASLARSSMPERSLVHRLQQGLLSRTDANKLLAAVNERPGPGPEPAPAVSQQGAAFGLALWTGQPVYKPDDLMTVYAQPTQACYLTLISVNAAGKATVLFPSEFDPDNLVRPDTPFVLPGDKAHYQFRLKEAGAETIIGRCQTIARYPAGVEPDYERQRFTVLGSYENFLRTSFSLDTDPARLRARAAKPVLAKDGKPDPKPELTARAAIKITIR